MPETAKMQMIGRKDSVVQFGMKLDARSFKVTSLGECQYDSPLDAVSWVDDDDGVLLTAEMEKDVDKLPDEFTFVEKAGPRQKVFFDPKNTTVGIVTCGGLCPGLNNVIRALVMCMWHRYGVRNIIGFKYGYQGLNPSTSECVQLNPKTVAEFHRFGGTMLGSSRGGQEVNVMVDFLLETKVDILFTLGGDGTQRGAEAISQEVQRRGCAIACVGVPKTIDNDVMYVERTFGFETAVELSQPSIQAAHEEARGAKNGIGIVKLMGRDSGFVALHAALANCDSNICLLPEVDFTFEQIINYVASRFKTRDHCVIVVAEGAGQDNFKNLHGETDASGNVKYGDIGVALRDALGAGLKARGIECTIKYIDPSYTIRSAPTNASDSVFCVQLAHMACHAAMAGKTGIIVGMLNSQFVHIPVHKSVETRKKVNIEGPVYQSLLDNTGQPKEWSQF